MKKDALGMFAQSEKRAERELRGLMRDWHARSEAVQKQIAFESAAFVLNEIRNQIPKGEDNERYRQSLRLGRVRSKHPLYAIFSSAKARKVRKLDVPKTILFVKAKSAMRRVPEEVRVLERFSPWTVDTLPFTPKGRDAVLVSLKASERDVAKVAKERTRDRAKWRRELDKAGIREVHKHKVGRKIDKAVRAIPDVALIGFRLEFGTGGVRPKPHWRPALRKLLAGHLRSIMRKRAVGNAMIQLGYRKWRQWPPRVSTTLSVRELRKFAAFQKRIGKLR